MTEFPHDSWFMRWLQKNTKIAPDPSTGSDRGKEKGSQSWWLVKNDANIPTAGCFLKTSRYPQVWCFLFFRYILWVQAQKDGEIHSYAMLIQPIENTFKLLWSFGSVRMRWCNAKTPLRVLHFCARGVELGRPLFQQEGKRNDCFHQML